MLAGDVYIGRLKWSDAAFQELGSNPKPCLHPGGFAEGGLVENVDFRIGELQPGAPWMQRAVQCSEGARERARPQGWCQEESVKCLDRK